MSDFLKVFLVFVGFAFCWFLYYGLTDFFYYRPLRNDYAYLKITYQSAGFDEVYRDLKAYKVTTPQSNIVKPSIICDTANNLAVKVPTTQIKSELGYTTQAQLLENISQIKNLCLGDTTTPEFYQKNAVLFTTQNSLLEHLKKESSRPIPSSSSRKRYRPSYW